MNNKLILTGITNNPGRILVRLLSENIELINNLFPGGIRAVCRSSSNISEYITLLPRSEIFTCDLTNVVGLKAAFDGADTVLHMAGIHWSREVFEAAACCGVRRIIAVHTAGVYSKYKKAGATYRDIDCYVSDICKKNNINVTILRPTMIFGNEKDRNMIVFIKMIDKLPIMPIINGGRYDIQPVFFEDLGKAFFDVLVHENDTVNKEYILSGEKPIQLRDAFDAIGQELKKKVVFFSCPYLIAYFGAWLLFLITFSKVDMREEVQRMCESRAFSHEMATHDFGYKPRSFSDGIAIEVNEYKREKGME